jgi:hypothetical protein
MSETIRLIQYCTTIQGFVTWLCCSAAYWSLVDRWLDRSVARWQPSAGPGGRRGGATGTAPDSRMRNSTTEIARIREVKHSSRPTRRLVVNFEYPDFVVRYSGKQYLVFPVTDVSDTVLRSVVPS